MHKYIILVIFITILLFFALRPKKEKIENFNNVFDDIYKNKIWGDGIIEGGSSGDGSIPEHNNEYLKFLRRFLKNKNIKSIVDIGCGDWQLMSLINLKNIEYHGYEVSKLVINNNKKRYRNKNINFHLEELDKNTDYKPADLLICKDVLQHLSFKKIDNILLQLKKYKYVIMINDINDEKNIDIDDGGYRSLDIMKPPFNITNIKLKHNLWDSNKSKTLYVIH